MKRAQPTSSALKVALAGGFLLLAGALALRHYRPVKSALAEAELNALRTERDALAVVDPAELAALRQRGEVMAKQRWSEAGWQNSLGSLWRWSEAEAGSERRAGLIQAQDPARIGWPAIVAQIERLESMPGLSVEAVTVTTSGSRSSRRIAAVQIKISIQKSGAGPPPTAAPVSPGLDRPARAQPTSGGEPESDAGDRVRPAAPGSAVLFAAPGNAGRGSVPGCARSHGRPDHPRLVRVGGVHPDETNPQKS